MAQPTIPIVFGTRLLPFSLLFSFGFELLGQTRYERDCDAIGYNTNRLFMSDAAAAKIQDLVSALKLCCAIQSMLNVR